MKIVLCANRHQASGKHIIYGLWFRVWTFFLAGIAFLILFLVFSFLFELTASIRSFFGILLSEIFLLVTFSIKHPYMNMHTYVYECSNTGWILIEFQHSTLVILIRFFLLFFFCFNAVQFLCEFYTFLYERYVNWKTGKTFLVLCMNWWQNMILRIVKSLLNFF